MMTMMMIMMMMMVLMMMVMVLVMMMMMVIIIKSYLTSYLENVGLALDEKEHIFFQNERMSLFFRFDTDFIEIHRHKRPSLFPKYSAGDL